MITISPAFKVGYQDLFDIGQEQLAVDRTVEYAGGDQAILTQGGNERRGLPVAVWRGVDQPNAAFWHDCAGGPC